jgi:hypothetical protein
LISIHRGDATGPVIATADSFQGKDGITEIQFTELGTTIPIRHRHPTLPLMKGSTFFRADNKQFSWKKHRELVEESNDVVLARYDEHKEPTENHKLGTLFVTPEGQFMSDVIVITCIVDQERADEGKWKVHPQEFIADGQKPEDAFQSQQAQKS